MSMSCHGQLRQRLSRCRTDDEIRRVLQAAQGCVIRRDEHALLDETQTGWLRYLGQVEVIDMRDRDWLTSGRSLTFRLIAACTNKRSSETDQSCLWAEGVLIRRVVQPLLASI